MQMKIHAFGKYSIYNKVLQKPQNSAYGFVFKAQENKVSFGNNPQYKVSGITEPFFDAIFKNVIPENEIKNIKDNFLSINKKYNPSLGYLFIETYNLGAKQRKEDSPGISVENKNKFAIDFALNVFYALKDKDGNYDFSGFRDTSRIIYNVQKFRKIEDMFGFIFSAKDEKTEKFQPDVALNLYKIILATNFQSPLDIKLYIEDYCRDEDGEIDDDNVDLLIKLMNTAGPKHVDVYRPYVYNPETKEFSEESIEALNTMLSFFLSEECKNKNPIAFPDYLGMFIYSMFLASKDPETGAFNMDIFETYFNDIRMTCNDDFEKMTDMIMGSDGEDI